MMEVDDSDAAEAPEGLGTRRAFSGAPWERVVGYCRALRRGDRIFVTGTAPLAAAARREGPEGRDGAGGAIHAPGDAYAQTVRCLEIIRGALEELDAGMEHVVRTRIFVTDIERWREIGRAHGEVFGDHPPATTMVEVRRLIHPEMLVEIEADAIV